MNLDRLRNIKTNIENDEIYHNGRLTAFYLYLMATRAKKFFKDKILELDKDMKYHGEYEREILIDKEELTKEELDNLKKFEEIKEQYREDNPDKYMTVEAIANTKEYSGFVPEYKFTLSDSVQGYKYASELIKELGNFEDEFPKNEMRIIKPEFREEQKKYFDAKKKELGIDKLRYKKMQISYRINLDRSLHTEDLPLEIYNKNYVRFLEEEK